MAIVTVTRSILDTVFFASTALYYTIWLLVRNSPVTVAVARHFTNMRTSARTQTI